MFYRFLRGFFVGLMKILFRVSVENSAVMPKQGPVILASNHLSFLDSPLLVVASRRTIHFVGKDSYFRTDTLKHRLQNWFFRKMCVFPINRAGGPAAQQSLQMAIQILQRGEVFGIYPEGTRSVDGTLYRGHTGVARIALATGAPIIPVASIGSNRAMPLSGGLHLVKVRARFGELIDTQPYIDRLQAEQIASPADNPLERQLARELTDRVMEQLALLSGQVYDPTTYGSQARQRAGLSFD
jgi:1-acyl-sn-glycerol-3-phosphate acyltransferase